MGRWLIALSCAACLQACGSDSSKTYRYPNPDNSAAVVIDVTGYGGAAGFVLNEVSLEAGGRRIDKLRTLEHMSETLVVWDDDRRVRFCYAGSMDHGSPYWSGTIDGKTYQIDFLDRRVDQTCNLPQQ